MLVHLTRTWDGQPADASEHVRIDLSWTPTALEISLEAPFHDDPPPAGPPGPTWRLWEHEVVEVMLLGPGDRYTEVELGPHGHHLLLRLEGRRNIVERELPLAYLARREGHRWQGRATVPRDRLPPGPHRLNAYAVHGSGVARRHLAWQAVPGPRPDFHQLERFIDV